MGQVLYQFLNCVFISIEFNIRQVHAKRCKFRFWIQLGCISEARRGSVFPIQTMTVKKQVEHELGYATMQVASFSDVYAGKLCAALDRQHPRDLFDVKVLFENEGLTEELRKTFIVFLISHQRSMVELLKPNFKKIEGVYEAEFYEMARVDVTLTELEQAREKMVAEISAKLTTDEKKFLVSFKSLKPDWKLLGIDNLEIIALLPSVRRKLNNLKAMNVQKHKVALSKLEKILLEMQ